MSVLVIDCANQVANGAGMTPRLRPQTASPSSCAQARRGHHDGPLLLPALSFGSGDDSFACRTSDRQFLVDLGGFIVTEDNRSDTYTLADGEVLTFSRANLLRICADVVRFESPAPAVLDGVPVAGTQVTTGVFLVAVSPKADDPPPGSPYYQDSIDLGHPGTLAACYSGYKALLRIGGGRHVLQVDLSAFAGAATTFTYHLAVRRD